MKLKEESRNSGSGRLVRPVLAGLPPLRPMSHDPIGQGVFETDVAAGFFGFQPLVAENLAQLGLELFVERRVLDEIIPVRQIGGHNGR